MNVFSLCKKVNLSNVKYANKNALIGSDNLNISIRNNIFHNSTTKERILKLSLSNSNTVLQNELQYGCTVVTGEFLLLAVLFPKVNTRELNYQLRWILCVNPVSFKWKSKWLIFLLSSLLLIVLFVDST